MYLKILLSIFLLSCSLRLVINEPITGVVSGAIAFAMSLGAAKFLGSCYLNECCREPHVKLDLERLQASLRKNLYGQHLAASLIGSSLKAHMKGGSSKALVLSFHGWTGSGKNYATQMIVNSTYQMGAKSNFHHMYIAMKDFPHEDRVQEYKERLQKEIVEHTKKCERSLFIFDEVDKIPAGVLDALVPFLDFHERVDGLDFRKNIFIFLSNAGGSNITNIALKYWSEGKNRAQIRLRDIEPIIAKGAFNEVGGFKSSEIVKKDLIDVYVPFLPLEKDHVRQCVKFEMSRRGLPPNQHLIQKVTNELQYYPPDIELFSASGCKRVSNKVDLFADIY